MCSICFSSIQDFNVDHTETLCPLRNSRYCSYCAQYGHLTKSCPAKPALMHREPAYLEQLLPPSEVKEQNVQTRTRIQYNIVKEVAQIIKIKDNERIITEYIVKNGIKVAKGFTKRDALEEYAKVNNKRLIYIL